MDRNEIRDSITDLIPIMYIDRHIGVHTYVHVCGGVMMNDQTTMMGMSGRVMATATDHTHVN